MAQPTDIATWLREAAWNGAPAALAAALRTAAESAAGRAQAIAAAQQLCEAALLGRHVEAAEVLLSARWLWRPVINALEEEEEEEVDFEASGTGVHLLLTAASTGDVAVIQVVLRAMGVPSPPTRSASPAPTRSTAPKRHHVAIQNALFVALSTDSTPAVDCLLQAGALVSAARNSPRVRRRGLSQSASSVIRNFTPLPPPVPPSQLSKGREITPLQVACQRGSLIMVSHCLRLGADANAIGDDGEAPIAAAARRGQLAMMRALLDSGAVPNAGIVAAAEGGHVEAVMLLLSRGASAYTRSAAGGTLLHCAAQHGASLQAFAAIAAAMAASVKSASPPEWQALLDEVLRWAIGTDRLSYAIAVLEQGASPLADEDIGTVGLAVCCLRTDVVQRLLAAGLGPREGTSGSVHPPRAWPADLHPAPVWALCGKAVQLRGSLERPPPGTACDPTSVTWCNQRLLTLAAMSGDVATIRVVIAAGGRTRKCVAEAIARLLTEHEGGEERLATLLAELAAAGIHPEAAHMGRAAYYGCTLRAMAMLLDTGISVNADLAPDFGHSAASLAAAGGRADMMEMLLRRGARADGTVDPLPPPTMLSWAAGALGALWHHRGGDVPHPTHPHWNVWQAAVQSQSVPTMEAALRWPAVAAQPAKVDVAHLTPKVIPLLATRYPGPILHEPLPFPSTGGVRLLDEAAAQGDVDMVAALLGSGADPCALSPESGLLARHHLSSKCIKMVDRLAGHTHRHRLARALFRASEAWCRRRIVVLAIAKR